MNEENEPQESVCSSGYGSNGTSEVTLFSSNEDANSSRSGSTEKTPDQMVTIHTSTSMSDKCDSSPSLAADVVVKRPKNTVNSIHRNLVLVDTTRRLVLYY